MKRGIVVCCIAALTVALAGCGNMSFVITPVPSTQELEEHVLMRESAWASDRIAVIDVDGVLSNARDKSLIGPPGDNPVALFKEKLDKAADDSRVKAIIVRINSPGGTVTASDIMYTELRNFRARTGKPAVASMLDVAASGGYYLACGTDKIYASPTTITGSIGVILIAPEFVGLMDKIGVRTNVFKSGELKDTGSPFREMNERDRAVLAGIIEQMYDRFFTVVKTSRKNVAEDKLRALANGRVYFASEAKQNGLVDEIGTIENAVAAAKSLAGVEKKAVFVVEYARPLSYRPNVYAESPVGGAGTQVNLLNVDLPTGLIPPTARFMYLWSPGW